MRPYWTPSWISQLAISYANLCRQFQKLQTLPNILVHNTSCSTGGSGFPNFLSWLSPYHYLYTVFWAVHPFVCDTFDHLIWEAHFFPNPWMDQIHIWSDDGYGSQVFLSTIPTPPMAWRSRSQTWKFIVFLSLLPNFRLDQIRVKSDDRKWFDQGPLTTDQ